MLDSGQIRPECFPVQTEVGFWRVEKAEHQGVVAGFRRNLAETGILPWIPAPQKPEQKPECAT
jgi:hypothetical protein